MCTCIFLKTKQIFFGRNMDIDYDLNEKILIVPRNYQIIFKKNKPINNHYAFIGMGTIIDNYPFFFDATNEHGLSMALLNFKGNAKYYNFKKSKINIAPYELLLYLLATCKDIKAVKKKMNVINIINEPYSEELPLAEVHFMISDKKESIVVETTKEGMKVYDNKYNVLTNNPPFPYHKQNISNYMFLSIDNHNNSISKQIKIDSYSNGQGAMFLPGDYSSASRFIKVFFIKSNMELYDLKENNINQFFNCLESVKMIKGTVKTKHGFEYTRYTSCVDVNDMIYYFKTYNNCFFCSISLFETKLDEERLIEKDIFLLTRSDGGG